MKKVVFILFVLGWCSGINAQVPGYKFKGEVFTVNSTYNTGSDDEYEDTDLLKNYIDGNQKDSLTIKLNEVVAKKSNDSYDDYSFNKKKELCKNLKKNKRNYTLGELSSYIEVLDGMSTDDLSKIDKKNRKLLQVAKSEKALILLGEEIADIDSLLLNRRTRFKNFDIEDVLKKIL